MIVAVYLGIGDTFQKTYLHSLTYKRDGRAPHFLCIIREILGAQLEKPHMLPAMSEIEKLKLNN